MILYINTTLNDQVKISLQEGGKIVASKIFKARYRQAEKLLLEIDKLLKSKKISLDKIGKIKVANSGGSFTSLRIGVVTANALAYALGIPVEAEEGKVKTVKVGRGRKINIALPHYDREPNITRKRIMN